MSSLVQYGKQKNQPIQLRNIDTFYRNKGVEITFVFCSGRTQVWTFKDEMECHAVYNTIIQNHGNERG